MRPFPLLSVIICVAIISACATENPYRPSSKIDKYATISDSPFKSFQHSGVSVVILSIDRKRVDSDSRTAIDIDKVENDKRAVLMTEGTHQLHVKACRYSLMHNFLTPFGDHYICGEAVLRLDAVHDMQYRVRSEVNRKKDYADFWIENAKTGSIETNPIRVNGLEWSNSYCCKAY
jgi:hypothetical protein